MLDLVNELDDSRTRYKLQRPRKKVDLVPHVEYIIDLSYTTGQHSLSGKRDVAGLRWLSVPLPKIQPETVKIGP